MRWRITAGAAGRHLRADWREAEYCAIDVETTGLDLDQDSVVSVGSVPIRAGRVIYREHYYSLIRPASPVSVAAMRVHYLRPADLAGAPPAGEVARQVADRLAGRIVVAHAAWIERAFLGPLLRQAGARFGAKVIDTAALARALGYAAGAGDGREPSLELLARRHAGRARAARPSAPGWWLARTPGPRTGARRRRQPPARGSSAPTGCGSAGPR